MFSLYFWLNKYSLGEQRNFFQKIWDGTENTINNINNIINSYHKH